MGSAKTREARPTGGNGLIRLILVGLSVFLEGIILLSGVALFDEYAPWIAFGIRVLALFLVLAIYGQNKTASIRMTWIIVILVAPLIGVTLYALIGISGSTRKMRRRFEESNRKLLPFLPKNEAVSECLRKRDPSAYNISEYIRNYAKFPVYDATEVRYFSEASSALESMLEDLAKAQHYIFMEYHAIEDAESFRRIEKVLVGKVNQGVEVRLFYDDAGSIVFINTDFVQKMEALGIRCRVFNPFSPGMRIFLHNRDHRKITVIDGKIGYTGGYNLANEYFNIRSPYGYWKDTGIRLEGDAVKSLNVHFLEMWNATNEKMGNDPDSSRYFLPQSPHTAASYEAGLHSAASHDSLPSSEISELVGTRNYAKMPECSDASDSAGTEKPAERAELAVTEASEVNTFVQPYSDTPMDDENVGENVYISMVSSAKRYAYFMTPYLIITDEMNHAFGLAAKRGVDVRIVTPGIPDKKIIYNVTRSYYGHLVKNGVRIFEYTPGFCHAKMAIIDDSVAVCGTINLDYRSLYHHFENACLLYGGEVISQIRDDFESTMRESTEVTAHYRRKRNGFLRLLELILRLGAPML